MKKLSGGLILLSIYGILLGILFAYTFRAKELITISFNLPNSGHDALFFKIALIFITLNILMLFLYDWVRKIILIISWIFIAWYIFAISMLVSCSDPGCLKTAIVIFFFPPLLVYSLIGVIYLRNPKLREKLS